jgi:type II secretory pathway pseudopilin PulG
MNKALVLFVALVCLVPAIYAAQLTQQSVQRSQQIDKDLAARMAALRSYKLASGKCLNAGGIVTIQNCNGNPSQNWKLSPRGQFVSQGGTCLTLLGTLATVAACQNSSRFLWKPTPEGTLVHSSGKCLTANGDVNRAGVMVMVTPCKGGPAQVWK